ncbi:MAG TPA: hypothetical protein VMC08_00545 [Bacteroidales bacterium]|nr:hypothetical protein [Bacteroidales bacterium]
MSLEIKKVESRKDLKRFIEFPLSLYRGNPYWCPPLLMDEYNTLRRDKNAAFEYCEAEYWLAYREGELVGRVAGIINPKANQYWNEPLVRFGWIDFIDDAEVSGALIRTVEEWGRSKGLKGIHGPLGFADMDREGMLVEGFEELSGMAVIYNYPYYPEHMVRMGFQKAADWLQYEFIIPPDIPEKVDRMARLVLEKYQLRVLQVKKAKELKPWARKMFVTLNEAYQVLYGYASISEQQMDAYTEQYFGFIRPEFVSIIIDEQDKVVAFGVSMPSLTRALQKCRGKLFPFGFLRLLRAIRRNDIIDMYLVGVRPDYQGKGVLALIYHDLHKAYLEHGVRKAVTSPQLEENLKAVTIWKNYVGRQHIRRRCWVKHWE